MNATGVRIDKKLVEGAINLGNKNAEKLLEEAQQISGLQNPNSVAQLKEWLENETGQEINSLNKKDIPILIQATESDKVKRLLEIRQELSKTSTKKYDAMQVACCKDDRVRGLLQFYGANRTGRWAGRLVQVQNLPQNHIPMLNLARDLVKNQNSEAIQVIYRKHTTNVIRTNQDSIYTN